MKVKIIDARGGQHRCDSRDPDLIGRWLIEHAARLVADGEGDAPMYLYVWPEDKAERDELGFHGGHKLTPADLTRALAAL